VLQLAVQTLQTYADARLSINISATTVNDPRWNSQLLDIIAATPGIANRLVIEITETAALGNVSTSHDFVVALRNLGCGVALDDFGAGYTSYRNLKELPISLIKLDGSFCCNLAEGGENATLVRSMVQLAHAFGHKVVAEWVDTASDAEILAGLDVDYLQGNMLGEASIIAPWTDPQDMAVQQETSNLVPAEGPHLHNMASSAPEPMMQDVDVSLLDDETLEAEIVSLHLASETETQVDVSPPLDSLLDGGQGAAPAPIEEVEPETEIVLDMEDNLFQLRDALAALNAAFGVKPSEAEEEERLAS
jgi:EAL domain-containing protein (putative c-di-GMP-specific phosphodiesterase class I)